MQHFRQLSAFKKSRAFLSHPKITMEKKGKEIPITSTAKIKEAAHALFLQKGFTATTIRDIAELAGTNVAALNYHFGSKKNLFEVVMLEKIQLLLGKLTPIFSNESTSLEQKIEAMVNSYIDFLLNDPDLITFILNEIRKNNFDFIAKARLSELVYQSYFMRQLKETSGFDNPIQFLMSLVGMIIFPFVAKPVILQTGLVAREAFEQRMQERKTLIPLWFKSILNAKP